MTDHITIERSYRTPLPIIGIPLPERENPIIVLLSENIVRVSGDIFIDSFCKRRVEIKNVRVRRDFAKTLESFIETLSRELGTDICLSISISSDLGEFLYLPLYGIVTHAIVDSLVEEMNPLDLAKALIVIDRSIGLSSTFNESIRFSIAESSSIAFRRGDEYIRLDSERVRVRVSRLRHVKMSEIPRELLEGEIGDLVTKLVGYTILKSIQSIREGDIEKLKRYLDLHNRLWSLIYDTPRGECLYVYDEWSRIACLNISLEQIIK
ncbi:MAG: hypothetical protein ABWJ42_05065 [Sulfolobales archaeon]